ncbi:hypothetical protein UH38_17510 [Aliterella atlantica CENA595]|uniref:Uncharacterized protein n=1 Tax=Aliterella atlantica CENA595 TaxID=1618023 RepID=A0A0D8ZP98_9CYAN|nr:hypothetical protein UH38_17510 [Aliterella atlantica CENA595]
MRHFWLVFFLAIGSWVVYQGSKKYLEQEQTSLIAVDSSTGEVSWSVPLGRGDSLARCIHAEEGRVFVGVATDADAYGDYQRYQIETFDGASGQ